MAEFTEKGIPLNNVKGIGVSGQQHGLVVLDKADQPIRPAKLWNDTSTELQCQKIVEAAGGIEVYRSETGNSLPPGFTASKILWIRDNEPDAYGRVHSVLLPHDFLNFYLTGEKAAEAGDASGTGYFNVRKRQWSDAVLEAIDPEKDLLSCLPMLIDSDQAVGQLRIDLSKRWGMASDVIVSSGGGDNMMGAIGSGNVEAGIMTLSLGTSGTIYSFSSSPVIDPAGEIAAFCDSTGGWLPLGCTMNVTVATELVRTEFLSVDHAEFDAAVDSVRPGSDGLVLLPYLEGERMPSIPQGSGVVLGLRPSTASPRHLARAAMEGVTMGLRYGLDRLTELGMKPREIRLIGGGAKSPVWRQIVSDVFDLPLVSPENREGPAFGAALQALWCVEGGDVRELASAEVRLDETTRCLPDSEKVTAYAELYSVYAKLGTTLANSPVFSAHRNLIKDL
jgi:D-xylulose kinase